MNFVKNRSMTEFCIKKSINDKAMTKLLNSGPNL
jgi:hypothetical protein